METDTTSVPVGEVLKKSSVWFALNNPDGWRRGDTTNAGISYQRYNGNGVDLNRDWPEKGFTFRPYTPASEPETATFPKVLKSIAPKWAGGVDLHGQLIDRAFSFTLLGASQRPFDKNQRMLQFTRGAYRDAEQRLAWNPLIKPNDAATGLRRAEHRRRRQRAAGLRPHPAAVRRPVRLDLGHHRLHRHRCHRRLGRQRPRSRRRLHRQRDEPVPPRQLRDRQVLHPAAPSSCTSTATRA